MEHQLENPAALALDNEGPTWHKLFRLVRYHESDVLTCPQRWDEQRERLRLV